MRLFITFEGRRQEWYTVTRAACSATFSGATAPEHRCARRRGASRPWRPRMSVRSRSCRTKAMWSRRQHLRSAGDRPALRATSRRLRRQPDGRRVSCRAWRSGHARRRRQRVEDACPSRSISMAAAVHGVRQLRRQHHLRRGVTRASTREVSAGCSLARRASPLLCRSRSVGRRHRLPPIRCRCFTVTWCGVRVFDSTRQVTLQASLLAGRNHRDEVRAGAGVDRGGRHRGALAGAHRARSAGRSEHDATGPITGNAGAIGERFSLRAGLDLVALARKFYWTHADVSISSSSGPTP